MQSSIKSKSKSPKSNTSGIISRKPKNYLNKNITKKYIYKKEKAIDTDKVLQNNKISKNIAFNSPINIKEKMGLRQKYILNNSNYDMRNSLEIRDDVNIDYDKYQPKRPFYFNSPSIESFNPINNNTELLNHNSFFMDKKNGYMTNLNININKWKCTQCGNVNSNFNYLCNNCNMPNNTLNSNNSITVNRNNRSSKNIESIDLDNNAINNSFKRNSFNNNSSYNLLPATISNDNSIKSPTLKKNSTNADLLNTYKNNQNNTIGYNTIRYNKNTNYFYSGANSNSNINLNKTKITNIDNNNINNNSDISNDAERYNNITSLYSYSNYLSNELKTSNDTNVKLLENYQNNEKEYNNYTNQNDLVKKKIKLLKEKEAQLDKINEQLQRSLSYIMGKHDNKKNESIISNNYIIKSLTGEQNINELKTKIKEFNKENEVLSDKLKENKNIIINLKKKIGELSGDKKSSRKSSANDGNKNDSSDLLKLKDLKEKITEYMKDIKNQNDEYNSLDNENKLLEKRIEMLKKQIKDDDSNSLNKINTKYNSLNINDNDIEKEKYIKIKEKNDELEKLFEQLNKIEKNNKKNKENEFDQLKEIYSNINKDDLMEMIKAADKEDKEMLEFIENNMNLLIKKEI